MRLKTLNKYANQKLQLPVVGEVQLDENASFDCADDKVEEFTKALVGSLEFSPLVRKSEQLKSQVATQPAAPVKTKSEKKKAEKAQSAAPADQVVVEDSIDDPDALKEAIAEASFDELKELISLVPGIKKEEAELLDQEGLKETLLSQIDKLTTKK